ncbi:hypothetical protein H6F32_13065 [Anabaena sp. FACHB-1237]|uniref:hypothetical protein n=1 Tax=Anabaena sp. FACHB-1237 TaxID=2692769 RepID=UPI001680CC82|nr:hypothetical protein [Anabaena sp. FACHB-1237]MBD2138500.1 hypothetical protein [Anabaena sp. FACHB-1237]
MISRQDVETAIHELTQQKNFFVIGGNYMMKISRQDNILSFKIDSEIEEIDTSANSSLTDVFDHLNERISLSFIIIIKIKNRYNHQQITESNTLFIEEILTSKALPTPIQDEYYSKKFSNTKDREEIYINYLLPNNNDYITLLLNTKFTEINIEENEYKETIKHELELLNLINRLAIKFSNHQISDYEN